MNDQTPNQPVTNTLETSAQSMQSETLSSMPPTENQMQTPPKKGFMWFWIVILLLILTAIGFAFFWSQRSNNTSENPTITPTGAVTLSPTEVVTPRDTNNPQVITPLPNAKVTSPVTVEGIVPPGWMFEGQVVLKLLDNNRNLIVQGAGKEKTPGSWTSGEPIDFEGTLTFTTTAPSGFLVIENDNPSGLPENQKSFEVPITF